MTNKNLNDFERDQLVEITNIGAGNAANALSQLVGKEIKFSVPDLIASKIEDTHNFFGNSEEIMTVVMVKLLGDIKGTMLLMFPSKSAIAIVDLLSEKLYQKSNSEILNEFGRSALKEIGNILAGSFMAALFKFLNLSVLQSVPDVTTDKIGSIMDVVLTNIIETQVNDILALKISLIIEGKGVESRLFLLFDPKATAIILEAVEKKYEGINN